MADIWDIEDEANRGRERTCARIYQNPGRHFKRVFRNSVYDVLKVLSAKEIEKVASPAA